MDSVINDKWWYAANSTRAAGATATHTLTWRTPNVGITIITMIDVDDNRCWIRNWKLVIVHALGNFFFYLWRKTNSCRISVGSIADRYAITEQKPTEKTNKLLFHFHFVSFLLFSLCLSLCLSEMFDLFRKIVDGCGRKTSVWLSSLVSSGFHQILLYSTLILGFFFTSRSVLGSERLSANEHLYAFACVIHKWCIAYV